MTAEKDNIVHKRLSIREKKFPSKLHIKLGLTKQLVKTLDKNGDCFKHICQSFPHLCTEKLKARLL